MMHICKKIKQEKYKILAVLIFVFAISVRLWNWPNTMSDINCDEAMSALNAKSIAESGKDIYGTTYPVYFEGWVTSGQSAFAIYITALFIKLFGFSIISIRLSILLISMSSLFFMPLLVNRIFKNKKIAIISLILLAINPWDIMQSQWLLDCNFYPHIMLIAVYTLLVGVQDKKVKVIYFSMILFAITLYTYGIALYLTPIFLCIIARYLLKKKTITVKQFFICILIFITVAIPIILMAIIQLFKLPTIQIGKITIQNFAYGTRTNDMLLFSKNKLSTLSNNFKYMADILIKQSDGLIWSALPEYGTIYLMSMPIIVIETVFICYNFFKRKEENTQDLGIALILTWLLISLLCGLLINDVNINRINIIWYVLIIINAIGIFEIIKKLKYKKILSVIFIVIYGIQFIGFLKEFHTTGSEEIANSFTWSKGLVSAIKYAENSNETKISLSKQIVNTDKKDIFIRYGTEGNQKKEKIEREEFMKYYEPQGNANIDFSTSEKEYDIVAIETNTILTEPMYIMTKEEVDTVNTSNYKVNEFNKYVVLNRK